MAIQRLNPTCSGCERDVKFPAIRAPPSPAVGLVFASVRQASSLTSRSYVPSSKPFSMWIVRLALRRPYTFVVVAILLLILGPIVIFRTPTDIFPNINIPVVSILWNYSGLNAQEMSDRIVYLTERSLTTTVDGIAHSESQSLNGIAVVKVFFPPNAKIEKAIAQITAISQTQLRQLPPGITPPLVITYSASSVPIVQLAMSGQKLSEQQLFDLGVNFIRTRLVTIPGCAIPYPYGGKQRQVQVDLNTQELQSKGLSPMDVVNASGAQNLLLPGGN